MLAWINVVCESCIIIGREKIGVQGPHGLLERAAAWYRTVADKYSGRLARSRRPFSVRIDGVRESGPRGLLRSSNEGPSVLYKSIMSNLSK